MPNREYLLELHSDRTAIKTKERVDYMKNRFICAEEVAQELSVSKPYAYKLIRKLNKELKAKGFILAGRLYAEHGILFRSERVHEGRKLRLWKDNTENV